MSEQLQQLWVIDDPGLNELEDVDERLLLLLLEREDERQVCGKDLIPQSNPPKCLKKANFGCAHAKLSVEPR